MADKERRLQEVTSSLAKADANIEIQGPSPESQPRRARVLVCGSNLSGAFDLAGLLEQYVRERGLSDVEVQVLRDASIFPRVFYNVGEDEPYTPELYSDRVPQAVLILPEMRQYDPRTGWGMTLDTYTSRDFNGNSVFENIKKLCEKHNVPFVNFSKGQTPKDLLAGLDSLLEQPKEPYPSA